MGIHFIATFLAVLIGAYIIPGVGATLVSSLVFAVLLSIVNLLIKPIIKLLTLPITILTLGLFALVLNALIVWGLARIVPNFTITGFWTALIFAILVSIISSFFALVFSGE